MKIAYDIKLMRPGCAIIQVALGADAGIASHFNSRDWLVAPTPELKVYDCTAAQLKALVVMTEKAAAAAGRDR